MPKMTSATSHTRRTFRIPDVDSLQEVLDSARRMWCKAHPDAARDQRRASRDHWVSTESLNRCDDFVHQQDLPVVLGNNRLHVWFKPGSTRSDALNLCVTVGIGARRQDFIQALPTILAWRERLTAAQGGEDSTGFEGVRTMIQGWKQAGATDRQIVARLQRDTVAILREAKDNPGRMRQQELMCVHGLLSAFGLKKAEVLSCCKTALGNLRQNLDAFGPPATKRHDRRLSDPQHQNFPITTEMVKTFLRRGRKPPLTQTSAKRKSA
jgi:hypothetical protein